MNSIQHFEYDGNWHQYFSVERALAGVMAHLAQLPSAGTAERHTEAVYRAGLKHFLAWAGDALPGRDVVQAYIASLKREGLKSSTINSKYLAPLRLYLRQLVDQPVAATGAAREYVQDCKEQIRLALGVRGPRPETVSNEAPLWRAEFQRLTLAEVNRVLRCIDRSTLGGLRDYALLHLAFSSALRLAELQRLTLGNFKVAGDVVLVTVRGKRNNVDPVPVSMACWRDVQRWAEAFRRAGGQMGQDDPLWQALRKGTRIDAARVGQAISVQALRDVIAVRTAQALGRRIAAHDTRRTAAAIAYDAGMGLPEIQALLRHKDAAVTLRYVGTKPDYAGRALGLRVAFG